MKRNDITVFARSMLDGMAAPFLVFRSEKIQIKIDKGVIRSAYRSVSEDTRNIRGYFEKAISHHAQEETAPVPLNKTSGAVRNVMGGPVHGSVSDGSSEEVKSRSSKVG